VVVAGDAAGSPAPLIYWIVPALLGQPWLRLFLLAEHAGCPQVRDMLANSRTTYPVPLRLEHAVPCRAYACPALASMRCRAPSPLARRASWSRWPSPRSADHRRVRQR
jgi:hypothetical protein